MRNIRFMVVGTTRRGALAPPEVLDDANSWRAFSAWRMDESRAVRAAFEVDQARVVWSLRDSANFRRRERVG